MEAARGRAGEATEVAARAAAARAMAAAAAARAAAVAVAARAMAVAEEEEEEVLVLGSSLARINEPQVYFYDRMSLWHRKQAH